MIFYERNWIPNGDTRKSFWMIYISHILRYKKKFNSRLKDKEMTASIDNNNSNNNNHGIKIKLYCSINTGIYYDHSEL